MFGLKGPKTSPHSMGRNSCSIPVQPWTIPGMGQPQHLWEAVSGPQSKEGSREFLREGFGSSLSALRSLGWDFADSCQPGASCQPLSHRGYYH